MILLLFVAISALSGSAQSFTVNGNVLELPSSIVFQTGTDVLKPESDAALKHIQLYLESKTYITLLRIEGHTDNDMPPVKQQGLSEKRAMAVVKWLIAHGIDCKRLLPVGFGNTKPIASGNTPEGRSQNQRITVVNASLRGRPIGGMPTDGGGLVVGDPCK